MFRPLFHVNDLESSFDFAIINVLAKIKDMFSVLLSEVAIITFKSFTLDGAVSLIKPRLVKLLF